MKFGSERDLPSAVLAALRAQGQLADPERDPEPESATAVTVRRRRRRPPLEPKRKSSMSWGAAFGWMTLGMVVLVAGALIWSGFVWHDRAVAAESALAGAQAEAAQLRAHVNALTVQNDALAAQNLDLRNRIANAARATPATAVAASSTPAKIAQGAACLTGDITSCLALLASLR